MDKDQSKETNVMDEFEQGYNEFLKWYQNSKLKLAESLGRMRGGWPVGQPPTAQNVVESLWNETEWQYMWIQALLNEVYSVRKKLFSREKELIDAANRTTLALQKIDEWMTKYQPALDEIKNEKDMRDGVKKVEQRN